MPPPGRSSPTRASACHSPPPAPLLRRRSPRPSPSPAPPAPFPSGPASAGPGAASSSDLSFGHLLHPRHATIEPAHHLADEWIILWARLRHRLHRLALSQPEIDLDSVTQPRAHV